MKPIIAFDGSCLSTGVRTGVERSFLLTLLAFAERQTQLRCVLFLRGTPPRSVAPFVDTHQIPRLPLKLWRSTLLPRELERKGARFLLSPTTALPREAPCHCIATVHEIPSLSQGAEEHAIYGFRQELAIQALSSRAWRVIVPSEHTARQLARTQPELEGRARVIAQPLHPLFRHCVGMPDPQTRKGFLFVGKDRRRKNLARIRQAWEALRPEQRRAHPLSIRGGDEAIETSELRDLIGRARVLLLLSLSEGFGVPALEALSQGTPVLASEGSVSAELCGSLASYANPYDIGDMSRAMCQLVRSDAQLERTHAAGPSLARRFTAERSAEGWTQLIHEGEQGA